MEERGAAYRAGSCPPTSVAPAGSMAPANTYPGASQLFLKWAGPEEAFAQEGFCLATGDLIGCADFLKVS